MFNISPEVILQNSSLNQYNKGKEYLRNRRIKSVQFNQEKLVFTATVLGTQLYKIHLHFNPEGNLESADCKCKEHEDGTGYCRHIIAVLLLIDSKDKQGFFKELKFRQAARHIFNFFQKKQSFVKSTVKVEPFLEIYRSTVYKAYHASLSLRMGEERLYIVKNVKKFLECMEQSTELVFGKNFTYEPSRCEFEGRDAQLIELLQEIYESEKLITDITSETGKASFFNEKEVYLTDSSLKRFFKLYENVPFKAKIYDTEHEALQICNHDIPMNFTLTMEEKDLLLNIDFEGNLIPITADGEYFYAGGSIYRISPLQQEHLKPFYLAMMYQKGRKLRFIEEDKERFVSEILPFAEKAGNLVISEQVESMMEKIPLQTDIYIDRSGAVVTADVRFIYGERVISPFRTGSKQAVNYEKLLIRDVRGEEAVLDILALSDFKVREGSVSLEGDDNICEFAFNVIPKLQEIASIYYSESFRNGSLKASPPISVKLRLNTHTDMLELGFNAEGLDRAELSGIFEAIAIKKKYFKLRSGSYLNLGSKEFREISGIVDNLGIRGNDLIDESIQLPKFRALYLDQALRDSGLHTVERNPSFKEFVQNIREPGDMEFNIPEELHGNLREYQKFGYKWLRVLDAYGLGGILADDMGLGKTIQVITLLLSARHEAEALNQTDQMQEMKHAPSIIVAPTSLVFNWCAELDKFAPSLKYLAVSGSRDERHQLIEELSEYDVVITSYPLIRRDIEAYGDFSFRYCILDEAQHIKNPDSVNAKVVKQINSKTRFVLTGTPMENNLTELWSLFDFILPGYLYSQRVFSRKYESAASGEDGLDALKELSRQIKPFVLRRLKKEVLDELPEKIEHTVLAELTDDQKRIYLACLAQAKGEIEGEIRDKGFERSHIKILAALTRLRQICCHPALFIEGYENESGKLQLLQEIIQESVEGGHRILVFSQFTSMLQIIRQNLTATGLTCLYLDGTVPAVERGYLVNSFNSGQGNVFLISLKAGGTGLNLTGADTVIHYDPWWNPAVEDQATDRSYRIGQRNAVHVMKLVAKGTIEEKILKLQESKRELINSVIQPGETLLTKMTQEDIQALFED